MENTGYKGEEKRKKRDDKGEEEIKREKFPPFHRLQLKITKTSQLVKLRHLLQNSDKEGCYLFVSQKEKREMKREKTGSILPVFADERKSKDR